MEVLLIALGVVAAVAGSLWIGAWVVGEVRERRDDEALAEVLRLRERGVLETEMADELLERAERAQRRLRKADR